MILLALACIHPDFGDRSAEANQACGQCHPEHQADFDRSRHAVAAESELFERLREDAVEHLGAEGTCDGCHAPEGDFTCLTCHAVAGNTGTSQGRLVADFRGPVRGVSDREDAPHATRGSDFLVDSALCGTCHDVEAPSGFSERPYQAWLESPAAARGEGCQSCHLPPTSYGTSHRFQGIADGDDASLELLARGVDLSWDGTELVLQNLTGHHYPDGASSLRELWLVPDVGAAVPLHARLLRREEAVDNPVFADAREERGLLPGETRRIRFAGAERVCLEYRPLRRALADALDLEQREAIDVTCLSR